MPGEFRSYIIELVVGFLYSGSLILDQQNFLEVLQLHGLLDIVDFDGVVYRSEPYHCAGKRKGDHPPPPNRAGQNAVITFSSF